jgi:HK97 family phage major capsid protein
MNDNSLSFPDGLLDKFGHPIVSFHKSLTGFGNDIPYMKGKPIAVCPSMPSIASGNNAIIYGNPMYAIQRRVKSASYIRRFWQNPTLLQFGLVGFESWMRVDSNVITSNAAHAPFQYIQCHS